MFSRILDRLMEVLLAVFAFCIVGLSDAWALEPGQEDSSILILSEPGDPIANGQLLYYTKSTGSIYGNGFYNDRGGVEVDYFTPTGEDHVYLVFHAPGASLLDEGKRYAPTMNYQYQSPNASLEVYTQAGSCANFSGAFEVLDIEWSPDGKLARFAADFEVRCVDLPALPGTTSPTLRGSVRFRYLPEEGPFGDSDLDGIINIADSCLNTAPLSPVDKEGCARSQFCQQIRNTNTCKYADWRNDISCLTCVPADCKWDSAKRICIQR